MVRAPIVLRYGVAIGAVAAALAGALLLQRFFEITPAVSLFLCGVLFAASFGGLGPGLLAIALSLLAFDYCLRPPLHSLVERSNDVLRLILFAVAALFVVGTAQRLRRARGELLAVVRELKGVETSLRAENADRQRAEAELRWTERNLQTIIDTIPAYVASYRPDGTPDFMNQTLRDMVGPSVGLEESRNAMHPDDRPKAERDWRAHLATGEAFQSEIRLRRANGEYRWHLVKHVALRDENGEIVKWYGAGHDVDDQKRAEDALRRSEAYLAEAQRLSITGSFGWRISSNTIVWSKETYRIFDVDPAVEPSVELVRERTHPDDREFLQRVIERMSKEDRDFDYEHRLLLADGIIKHLHVRTHRVRFDSGELEIVGALMDVTAARKAEESLRRAQAELAHATRVATLGEMSASIAHEVNQPLAAIASNAEAAIRWLNRKAPEKEEALRSITLLINEAHRASQVIDKIRELSKKAESKMSRIDINNLVEEVMTLVHGEAVGHRVSVRPQLASGLPPARGDKVQLQQVLINLVMNGIQAMAPVTDRPRVLVIRTQRHSADEVLVAVEDAGIGIESENLNRLFSAFYTTKPDGMGMGLSISRSIVEAHGGRVWATPNTEPGMTFQFTLSAYREEATAGAST